MTLGAAERVLLATKLHPPLPRGLVPRPGLVERLRPTERRLTVLDAPAGWGKTSLVAQWAQQPGPGVRVAWLGLDRDDDDPVLFWSYVIAALRTQETGMGAAALAALGAGATALRDAAIPSLVNDLLTVTDPIVLVLDDFHVITEPDVHATVALLLGRLPPALHLVVCARGTPALPLGRLRAEGELVELRAEELALTDTEIDRVLADVPGVTLTGDDVARLARRTEGWPAGVALARASLAARPTAAAAFVAAFTGTDRYVLDYLGHEVLAGLPDDVRAFLLQTSILARLSPPLCAAVTGRPDAAALLDRTERTGVFLTALDPGRQWFRYHRLFGELLRHELTLTAPLLVPQLHRRAASWSAGQGAITDAVEHFVAAGDVAEAGELVAARWNEWFNRGRHTTVTGWLDRLPPAQVRGDARLCTARAWLALDHGDLDVVDRWLAAGEIAADPADLPIMRDLAVLRSVHRFKTGDLGAAAAAARRILELDTGEDSFASTVAHLMTGIAAHWAGADVAARRPLAQAVRMARRSSNELAETYALGYLALGAVESGAFDDAARAVPVAVAAAADPGVAEHFVAALPLLAAATLHSATGRPERAADASARALALAGRGAGRLELAAALAIRARTAADTGDDGQPFLDRARALIKACPEPGPLLVRLTRTRITRPDAPKAPAPSGNGAVVLSGRERELLPLLAGSLSQRDIGGVLHLSLNTVKTHSRVLFRKLGVSSRAEAVARARQLGLL